MQSLFAFQFGQKKIPLQIKQIIENVNTIDKLIKDAAPERPLNQINRIDLSILRLAVFELIIVKEEAYKVIVDEAVELGKGYGGDTSASFINGVLGKIIEGQNG